MFVMNWEQPNLEIQEILKLDTACGKISAYNHIIPTRLTK